MSPTTPTYKEGLRFWLQLGLISFGGPAGQVAIMHDYLVEKKQWISNEKFLHALNYCMLLPGPEAQQLAIYTGWLLHGIRGGLTAGILFVLPATILLWALSAGYVYWGNLPVVQAGFEFLKPAIVAIVACSIIKIGKKSLHTLLHYMVAVAAFIALCFFNVSFPVIILASLLIGGLYSRFANNRKSNQYPALHSENKEPVVVISCETPSQPKIKTLIQGFVIAILLWMLPLILLALLSDNYSFWKTMALFFTKAAFVTFGGAYAVLPYVAQVSVEEYSWLSKAEMMDGIALGETTPGPLIIVLAFVGFMAGYHHAGATIGAATIGLAITVWYTFLPSFLFIFAGAPWIERTNANPAVQSLLQFATAAVTGVIFSLCLYLGQDVIFSASHHIQWPALIWVGISFLALQFFRINLLIWIALSLGLGICLYWASLL
jgi:chromate transporter